MKKTRFHSEELIEKFGRLEDKKYIAVLDLELTCWDDTSWDKQPKESMEIIEIGIEVLDLSYKVVGSISETVKPIYYPILSDYCKNLTGITQQEIQASRNLSVTVSSLKDRLPDPREFVWACWGKDSLWLQEELHKKAYKTEWKNYGLTEFDPRCINVKLCCGIKGGLKRALDLNGLEQVKPAHRALSDAKSTADLLTKLKLVPVDAQYSNDRTYKEALRKDQLDMVEKLNKRLKINNKEVTYKVLKYSKWNYETARKLLEVFKSYK